MKTNTTSLELFRKRPLGIKIISFFYLICFFGACFATAERLISGRIYINLGLLFGPLSFLLYKGSRCAILTSRVLFSLAALSGLLIIIFSRDLYSENELKEWGHEGQMGRIYIYLKAGVFSLCSICVIYYLNSKSVLDMTGQPLPCIQTAPGKHGSTPSAPSVHQAMNGEARCIAADPAPSRAKRPWMASSSPAAPMKFVFCPNKKVTQRTFVLCLIGLLFYSALFFILMERGVSAMNDEFDVVSSVSYRYGVVFPVRDEEGIYQVYREKTFWNDFFSPIEKIFFTQ